MKKSITVKIREFVRLFILSIKKKYMVIIYGMDISSSARISIRATIDKTYPQGIHIDDETFIASGSIIISHDYVNNIKKDSFIGKKMLYRFKFNNFAGY
jgi:hypothetical protein